MCMCAPVQQELINSIWGMEEVLVIAAGPTFHGGYVEQRPGKVPTSRKPGGAAGTDIDKAVVVSVPGNFCCMQFR